MIHRQVIGATSYVFDGLRDLLAKAAPPRSGDRLAGVAAESAEQMIAARMALADVPLRQFLNEAVIPYEDDEVTRLIIDSHDAVGFAAISSLTVGGFRDWLLSDAATGEMLAKIARGITPEMAAAVSKLMRNQELIAVAAAIIRLAIDAGLQGYWAAGWLIAFGILSMSESVLMLHHNLWWVLFIAAFASQLAPALRPSPQRSTARRMARRPTPPYPQPAA